MRHLAIWGHLVTDARREGTVEGIVERCRRVGIDTYLAYVYPMEKCFMGESDCFAYRSTAFRGRKEDLFTPLLKAAKREGIDVQPWLLPFRPHLLEGESEEEVLSRTYRPIGHRDAPDGAGYATTAGKRLCPTWPENRARAMRMLHDYIENHGGDLTGIHLDYIRYGDAVTCWDHPCHCPACRSEYEELIGKDTITAEDLRVPGVLYRFIQFRRRCIRALVEQVRDVTRRAGLRLTMAARVQFFDYALPEGQDWPEWARDGLVDAIYLMNYSLDRTEHLERVRLGLRLARRRRQALFCDGVGKKSSLGLNPTENVVAFIRDSLAVGVDGISIFHYNGMTDDDFEVVRGLRQAEGRRG